MGEIDEPSPTGRSEYTSSAPLQPRSSMLFEEYFDPMSILVEDAVSPEPPELDALRRTLFIHVTRQRITKAFLPPLSSRP